FRFFRDWSIQRKLYASFGIILVFLGLVGVGAFQALGNVGVIINRAVADAQAFNATAITRYTTTRIRRLALEFETSRDPKLLDRGQEYLKVIQDAEKTVDDLREKDLADEGLAAKFADVLANDEALVQKFGEFSQSLIREGDKDTG